MGVSLPTRHEIIALQNPVNSPKVFHLHTCSKVVVFPLPSPRMHWESRLSFWTAPRWVHSHHQRTPHMEACMFKEIHILYSQPNIIHNSYTDKQHFKITRGENSVLGKLTCKSTCWVWPQVSWHFTTTIVVAVIFQNVVNIGKYYTIPVQVLHGLLKPTVKQHGTIERFISGLWKHNIDLTSFPLPLTITWKWFYNEIGLI